MEPTDEPPVEPADPPAAPAEHAVGPLVDHPKPLGPPWPDYEPPRRAPPVIPPRAPGGRGRGLFKPEHRMVLFLLAASSGALLLSLLFPKAPGEGAEAAREAARAAPTGPLEWPRARGETVALQPMAQVVVPAADLEGAMERVVPAVNRCSEEHAAALAPLDGRVVLRLTVGARGLESAVLVDVAEVAPVAADCLSYAAWGAGWPEGLAPQSVTLPFFVVAPLGGEAPAPEGEAPGPEGAPVPEGEAPEPVSPAPR